MPQAMFSMQNSGSDSATMARPEITKNTHMEASSSTQATELENPATSRKKKKTKKAHVTSKKLDTKVLSSMHDDNYASSDEASDSRDGGRKTLPLLLKVSKHCRTAEGKKLVRCIGSAGCGKTWIRPRDKTRILKHVMSCGYVANLPGGSLLVQEAINAMAVKAPGLLDELTRRMGAQETRKRPHVDESTEPRKRIKIDLSCQGGTSGSSTSNQIEGLTHKVLAGNGQEAQMNAYKTEGRRAMEQEANSALVEFLVGCGIPPNVLSSPTFGRFVAAFKTKYILPSRSKFEDALVPAYAATVRLAIQNHLQTCHNLNISFDGGKLTKKKFFSVHITTPEYQSFCLELDDVALLSQTGEYLHELLQKVRS